MNFKMEVSVGQSRPNVLRITAFLKDDTASPTLYSTSSPTVCVGKLKFLRESETNSDECYYTDYGKRERDEKWSSEMRKCGPVPGLELITSVAETMIK